MGGAACAIVDVCYSIGGRRKTNLRHENGLERLRDGLRSHSGNRDPGESRVRASGCANERKRDRLCGASWVHGATAGYTVLKLDTRC